MSRTLYQLHEDLIRAEQEMQENEGVISPELEAFLERTDIEIAHKLQALIVVSNEFAMFADRRKFEISRLQTLVSADQAKADQLKARVKDFMESHGYDKVKTDMFNLSIAKNGGATPLIWEDGVSPESAPKEFVKEIISYKFDTKAIQDALKNGVELPFVKEGERGTHLRIK